MISTRLWTILPSTCKVRILIDTHTLLWFHEESDRLSVVAREIILRPDSERFVSYATLWEITIKASLKRLHLNLTMADFVAQKIENQGMRVLNLELNHLGRLASLPWHHRDPFDRMMVAQALEEELTLISCDAALSHYPVKVLW